MGDCIPNCGKTIVWGVKKDGTQHIVYIVHVTPLYKLISRQFRVNRYYFFASGKAGNFHNLGAKIGWYRAKTRKNAIFFTFYMGWKEPASEVQNVPG